VRLKGIEEGFGTVFDIYAISYERGFLQPADLSLIQKSDVRDNSTPDLVWYVKYQSSIIMKKVCRLFTMGMNF